MKPQSLLSSAIAFCLIGLSAGTAHAQERSVSIADNSNLGGTDFKLNREQRKAISGISDFAFDQFDLIVETGLDPKKLDQKLDRTQRNQQVERVNTLFSSFLKLDDSQKGSLRSLLQKARDQMNHDMQRSE
jgi:hypothetical protein